LSRHSKRTLLFLSILIVIKWRHTNWKFPVSGSLFKVDTDNITQLDQRKNVHFTESVNYNSPKKGKCSYTLVCSMQGVYIVHMGSKREKFLKFIHWETFFVCKVQSRHWNWNPVKKPSRWQQLNVLRFNYHCTIGSWYKW
jgi:hypothetical protein